MGVCKLSGKFSLISQNIYLKSFAIMFFVCTFASAFGQFFWSVGDFREFFERLT